MKPRIRIAVASLGLISVFAAAPLVLAGQAYKESPPQEAEAHHGGMVDRTIVIDSTTKWVNVTENETIRFLVDGPSGQKSFAWIFDSYDQGKDLKQIAPKGMLGDRSIKVYVADDPRGRI